MSLEQLDVLALRRWVITTRAAMSTHADAINALNVFPVADRDTGTNMSVTMELAVDGLAAEAPGDLLTSVEVLARSTVLAARGNSGVILSQLVRGLADVVIALDGAPLLAPDVADVLAAAARRARGGVRSPVEGTMLSVADAAARTAAGASHESLGELVDQVVAAAQDAVARTREQLPVLREAGVVDAGAVGYWLVLRALQHVVHREPGTILNGDVPAWLTPPERACPSDKPRAEYGFGGPAYELMFVLRDGDDVSVERLAESLSQLGDSLVIAGGGDLCSVHVHLDDLAAGVNAGVAAGRPDQFQITRFADQLAAPPDPIPQDDSVQQTGSSLIVALDSPGLASLVHDAHPAAVVLIAPGADALDDALADGDGWQILVDTPRLHDLACAAVVDRSGSRVGDSRHPAQLIAALSMLCTGGSATDVSARSECDRAADDVGVHVVDRAAGDENTADVVSRCRGLMDSVVCNDTELVTLVSGANAPQGLLETLEEHLQRHRPQADVTSYVGGRPGVVLDVGCE